MSREIVFKGDPNRPVIDTSPMTLKVHHPINPRLTEWGRLFEAEFRRITQDRYKPPHCDLELRGIEAFVTLGLNLVPPHMAVKGNFTFYDDPQACARWIVAMWDEKCGPSERPNDVRPWRRKGDA